jgi:hypothetical protein
VFGIGRAKSALNNEATAKMLEYGKGVKSIKLIVVGEHGESSVSFEKHGKELTRSGMDVKDDDAVKFAFLFFTVRTLQTILNEK